VGKGANADDVAARGHSVDHGPAHARTHLFAAFIPQSVFMKLLDQWGQSELKHSAPISAVAVSPDGKHVLSASMDKTLKPWDVCSKLELATLDGHAGAVTNVRFTSDGTCALSAGWDKTLRFRLWDLVRQTEIRAFEGHRRLPKALALSPDGRYARDRENDDSIARRIDRRAPQARRPIPSIANETG
jgi:WD40 repeat protein